MGDERCNARRRGDTGAPGKSPGTGLAVETESVILFADNIDVGSAPSLIKGEEFLEVTASAGDNRSKPWTRG